MVIRESLFSAEYVMSDHLSESQSFQTRTSNTSTIQISSVFLKFFGSGLVLLVLLSIGVGYFQNRLKNTPHTYEQCLSQPGSKILEKYPPVCITADGASFTATTDMQQAPAGTLTTATPLLVNCKRTGCSGELCIDSYRDDVVTTCDFKPEYACYQEAPCERQTNGECGFTVSRGLSTCLEKAHSSQ